MVVRWVREGWWQVTARFMANVRAMGLARALWVLQYELAERCRDD